MTDRLMIINADDFGASPQVNEGIIRSHVCGLVKGASLLVNMPAAEQAAQMAARWPGLETGLHFNISEGFAIAPAREIYLLVDDEGRFRFDCRNIAGSIQSLKCAIAENSRLLDQIAVELDCQIKRFRALGFKMSHINFHHYLSLTDSRLFEVYARAAERAGVSLRGLCSPAMEFLETPAIEVERMADIIRNCSTPSPDISMSNPFDVASGIPKPQEYLELMMRMIASLAEQSEMRAVEIITHPTLAGSRQADDGYGWARLLETGLVASAEFRRFVEELGFRIGGYGDLMRI